MIEPEAFDVTGAKALPLTGTDSPSDITPVAGDAGPRDQAARPGGRVLLLRPRADVGHASPHTIFRYQTNGGGGFGNPLEREPERVKVDVRDGYVTIEGALRDYGVVVVGDPESDPEGLTVDAEATAELRG